PVDDPGVVARHPLAQPLEEPALARAPHVAEARLAAASRLGRERPDRGAAEAGEHGRAPGELEPGLKPGEPERAQEPNVEGPALAPAPPLGGEPEHLAGHGARREREPAHRRREAERRRERLP